jgi:hypothetical protein
MQQQQRSGSKQDTKDWCKYQGEPANHDWTAITWLRGPWPALVCNQEEQKCDHRTRDEPEHKSDCCCDGFGDHLFEA